jgi:hypothetical protein
MDWPSPPPGNANGPPPMSASATRRRRCANRNNVIAKTMAVPLSSSSYRKNSHPTSVDQFPTCQTDRSPTPQNAADQV